MAVTSEVARGCMVQRLTSYISAHLSACHAYCHYTHTRCKTGHHVDDDEQEDGTMAETHFPHDGPTTTVVVTPVAAAASDDDDDDGDE